MRVEKYHSIVNHYEDCLKKHGDTHLGVDWPNKTEADMRYKIMLEVIKPTSNKVSLLDFGCGLSHLYEYMLDNATQNIEYSGLDLSQEFINASKRKYPDINYYCLDILDTKNDLPDFDYIVMNGVFTEKCKLSFSEMFEYFKKIVSQVFMKSKRGIVFNVMSSHVDWERDDLFHLPLDMLASFVIKELSRNFIIRNDYGLYEYTTYIYRGK